MTETLVIRLRGDGPASWMVVDAVGARSGAIGSGELAAAAADADPRRVLLLVPGSEIHLAAPQLPARGGARLLQAIPFALEEQLASDVDGLHFALGPRSADGSRATVAAVARGRFEEWLGACSAAGITPDSVLSDAFAVPCSPRGLSLLLDGRQLYVSRGGTLPFVLDADPLDLALELALTPPAASTEEGATDGAAPVAGESAATGESPAAGDGAAALAELGATPGGEHVTFYASAADYEREQVLIEGLRERVATLQVKLLPDGPLPLLAAHASTGTVVELLQGGYAAKTSFGERLKRWRLPAALAAAALLVLIGNQAVGIWQLRQAEKQVDAQIAELFAQVLPGQPVVDARAQLQGVLNQGRGAGSGLLPALTVIAQALAQTPSGKLESISYRGDGMDLRMTAPTVEAIDAVKQHMSQNGIAVELQSATPRGDVVEGRLQVRWGSA
jgi:general secretion pathway protein L